MNVSYKGVRKELPPKLQAKLDAKFAKLSKLLERRGEREAHVVLTAERHLHQAEITLQFYDHQLVGVGRDGDVFTAMSAALDKLETQAVKTRGKWREKKRRPEKSPEKAMLKPEAAAKPERAAKSPKPAATRKAGGTSRRVDGDDAVAKIFRVNHHDNRKPMTLEEAMLEMEGGSNYLVYRDAEKDAISVLVRRKDGHFDLIEG